MARESAVYYSGVILTVLLITVSIDCRYDRNIYASTRYLALSASLISAVIVSPVPEFAVKRNNNNAHINTAGILDLQELLQTKLTTKKGVFGQVCDISSFVTPEAASSVMPRKENAGDIRLGGINTVWLCIAPTTQHKFKEIYIHLGNTSKIKLKDLTNIERFRSAKEVSNQSKLVNTTQFNKYYLNASKKKLNEIYSAKSIRELVDEGPWSSVDKSVTRTPDSNIDSEFRTSERIEEESSNTTHNLVSVFSANSINRKESPDNSHSDLISLMLMDSAPNTSDRTSSAFTDLSPTDEPKVSVSGMRVEEHSKGIYYDDGTILLQADYNARLLLFGRGLEENMFVQFTAKEDKTGSRCDVSTSDIFKITEAYGDWARVDIKLPTMLASQEFWYLCMRDGPGSEAIHQDSQKWLTISTYDLMLPIWLQVIILIVLLLLSGLFSGLNLGLMALDKTELKVVLNTGTPHEKQCAKAIEPVRRHGNFLLCTLLLGNVLVNSSLTILLDTLSSGLIAVIGSTIGIVIFGEIIPQAICSRHGLVIGAKTVRLVQFFMIVTGILAWPISKILDYVLGEELGSTYNRERLKELIRVQDCNDIRVEEQNIIYGALELHKKTVAEVMTKLSDVFMLNIESNLDFDVINEIMQQGYSRIPIYENDRKNIVSVLFIKDLAFIDPDDNTPLRTVSQFYQNVCNFVYEDTTLDVIFKQFKQGNKGHMAFINHVNADGDRDPFYEVIGVVTLEDVIEELIQEEIVDETDVFTDNKTKRRRKIEGRKNFKEFLLSANPPNQRKVQISPQLQVAAFQFMRTSIEPFDESHLSDGILKRLLNQDTIHMLKSSDKKAQNNFLYTQGKAVDFFVLILEGHVEVTIGKENLTFVGGPFTYFGLAILQMPLGVIESPSLSAHMSRNSIVGSIQSLDSAKTVFIPDYSVKANSEVTFVKIRRLHYIAGRRAFLLEKIHKDPDAEENFVREFEKILRAEEANSPVREIDTDTENATENDMLVKNGSTVRSKSDQEDVELSILQADNRRRSLRETLPQLTKTLEARSSSEDYRNGSSP